MFKILQITSTCQRFTVLLAPDNNENNAVCREGNDSAGSAGKLSDNTYKPFCLSRGFFKRKHQGAHFHDDSWYTSSKICKL